MFPNVLFYCDGMVKTWSVSGFTDLKQLNQRVRKHEVSVCHLNCCTDLAVLGSTVQLVYRQNVMKHNEQVTKVGIQYIKENN